MATEQKRYDFSKLLEKTNNVLASQGQPTLTRSIAQLGAAVRKLAQKPEVTAEINAQLFFASKGLDLAKHASHLRTMSLGSSVDMMQPVDDLDVDRFLEQQQELLVSSAVEECAHLNSLAFQQSLLGQIEDDWDLTKQDIVESMNFHTSAAKAAVAAVGPIGVRGASPVGDGASGTGMVDSLVWRDETASTISGANTLTGEHKEYAATLQDLHIRAIQQHTRHSGSIVADEGITDSSRVKVDPVDAVVAMRLASERVDVLVSQQLESQHAMIQSPIDTSDIGVSADAAADAVDCWNVIETLTRACHSGNAPLGTHANGSSVAYYTSDPSAKQRLVEGALSYLQDAFLQHIHDTVDDDRQVAAAAALSTGVGAGEHPGTATLVDAYVRSEGFLERFTAVEDAGRGGPGRGSLGAEDAASRVAGDLSWARVYMCLRVGDVHSAILVVKAMQSNGHVVDKLIDALIKRSKGNDPGQGWEALYREYVSATGQARTDPFRITVYVVVGRLRVDGATQRSMNTYVLTNIEDYLWLKLSVAWVSTDPLPSWLYAREATAVGGGSSSSSSGGAALTTLEQLQSHVTRLGEKHFGSGGSTPLLYTRVLLLTQQFELAVNSLIGKYPVLAAYIAFGLYTAGLLSVTHPDAPLLVLRSSPSPSTSSSSSLTLIDESKSSSSLSTTGYSINFAKIILNLAETCAHTAPVLAFHYIYTLRHLSSSPSPSSSSSMPLSNASSAMSFSTTSILSRPDIVADIDLLTTTKAFDALIGTTRSLMSSDVVARGPILIMLSPAEAATVITTAADRLSALSDYEPAMRLYTLGKRYDNVAQVRIVILITYIASWFHILSHRIVTTVYPLISMCFHNLSLGPTSYSLVTDPTLVTCCCPKGQCR